MSNLVEHDLDKVLVLDVETSGIDPIEHGILSVGAAWLTDLTKVFYEECRLNDYHAISPKALEINGFSEKDCRDMSKRTGGQVAHRFIQWAKETGAKFPTDKIVIAGEQPFFDKLFIQFNMTDREEQIKSANWMLWPFSPRMLDLHSVSFSRYHMSLNHPKTCESLLLSPEDKPHHALKGAMSEARCLRKFLGIDPIVSHEGSTLGELHD